MKEKKKKSAKEVPLLAVFNSDLTEPFSRNSSGFFHISQSSSAFTYLFQYFYIYITTPSLLEPLSNSLLCPGHSELKRHLWAT